MKKVFMILFILVAALAFAMQAQATLYNRGVDSLGNRLIYDSDLNITWYDFTNSTDWFPTHWNWASGLTVDFGGDIYDDWRLPITFDNSCEGNNCTNSELGHLYYTELGNNAYYVGCTRGVDCGLTNTGDFLNLQPGNYWSETDYDIIGDKYDFSFYSGNQDYDYWGDAVGRGIAVRAGDVPDLTVVPEPVSMILFVIGGITLGLRRFIKRK